MRVFRILAFLLLGSSLWAASDLRQIGMVNIPGSPGFTEMAFANGMVVITHTGASTVDIFDPVHRRVVAQITGLQSPRGLAVDEQAGKVYIADHSSNAITIVSFDGWKAVDTIPLTGSPDALLLDQGKLYWTDADAGRISVIDTATKQNMSTVEVGGTPRDLVLDSDRNVLFTTLQDQHQVVAIDPELKIVNRFTLNASQPTGLAYDWRTHELYVAVRYAVLAINPQTGVEINRVPAPAGVDSLWIDPNSHMLYAASNGSLLTIRADGRLSVADEIYTDVKGHTVAYDAGKNLVLLPGGREGKSKLLIFRSMGTNSQEAKPGEARADVQ
jgi:YVTN family beta-propeller protein